MRHSLLVVTADLVGADAQLRVDHGQAMLRSRPRRAPALAPEAVCPGTWSPSPRGKICGASRSARDLAPCGPEASPLGVGANGSLAALRAVPAQLWGFADGTL